MPLTKEVEQLFPGDHVVRRNLRTHAPTLRRPLCLHGVTQLHPQRTLPIPAPMGRTLSGQPHDLPHALTTAQEIWRPSGRSPSTNHGYIPRMHALIVSRCLRLGANTGCCTINPIIRDTFHRHFVVDFALLG